MTKVYTEGDNLDQLFDAVYEIMKESFPRDEFRSYEGQKALLEHLACTPLSRGLGIGTKLVQDILSEAGNHPVILEVEPPVDKVTKRRVGFYERLGFVLNLYPHYQPPLNLTTDMVELKIMSSFKALEEEEQKAYRRILNQRVYGVDAEFRI